MYIYIYILYYMYICTYIYCYYHTVINILSQYIRAMDIISLL